MWAILTEGKADVLPGHFLVVTQHMALGGPSQADLTVANSHPLSAIGSRNTNQKDIFVIHRLRVASRKDSGE